ncbi:hypothetical protein GTP55_13595 [Duganella sp. FT109W]|uniref:Fimbrial assembly protein n=1 Tax=Duganella margarita TaxID=2692170 RepID=A0ABW9WH53_9BURK|nr:hypothetical protein [Duganella margarita]MYN40408.1 hypothetical protein [Duganella margarita]
MDALLRVIRPQSRSVVPLLALSILIASVGVWVAILGFRLHEKQASITERVALLRANSVEKPKIEPTKVELDELKQWALLQTERQFRWRPLFNAVEKSTSPDIELLEFQPDKANRKLLLRGEARDDSALLAFVDALAEQPALSHVHITHTKTRRRDRLVTVIFEVKANFLVGIF